MHNLLLQHKLNACKSTRAGPISMTFMVSMHDHRHDQPCRHCLKASYLDVLAFCTRSDFSNRPMWEMPRLSMYCFSSCTDMASKLGCEPAPHTQHFQVCPEAGVYDVISIPAISLRSKSWTHLHVMAGGGVQCLKNRLKHSPLYMAMTASATYT